MAFDKPQSRNEAILQNMLGANNELEPPKSRIEYLLQQILENGGGGGQSAIHVKGVTTTALTDGCDTNPITINGESYTAVDGDLVAYQNKEFLFNGTIWQELGDVSEVMTIIENILKDIAQEFDATASYAVGDYVLKDGVLYKCTTAHTGAWDADDFTATTISDEVADVSDAVDAILDGASIDSFADVETALAGKQDTLTAGDYINLNNGNISVNRNLVGNNYDYEIKSAGDYKLTIIKSQGGTVISTNTYDYSYGTSTNIDNNFTIAGGYSGGNTWVYTALKDSTTHSIGYTWTKSVEATFEETESFPSEDLSGYKLVIKSEMDTALSGKQNTLTFDSVPTDGSTNPVESNGVYDALATKQGATDNNLQTTDKTVVGAINEHKGDIDSLKSGLTNLSEEVNGDATTYDFADVVTIEDAVPANLADCSVKIEPVQDLHGQSAPYVGGAGKNKLPMTVDSIKAFNTMGTWSGNVYTYNDVTTEILTDAGNNVIGFKINGQPSDGGVVNIFYDNLPDNITAGGTYILSWDKLISTFQLISYDSSPAQTVLANDASVTEKTITIPSNCVKLQARIAYIMGVNYDNVIIKPMIRLSTETDATFAPYTNLCPISGHTEASVNVHHPDFYTTANTVGMNQQATVEILSDKSFRVYNTTAKTYISSKQLVSRYNLVVGKTYTMEADADIVSGNARLSIRNEANSIVAGSNGISESGHLVCTFTLTSEMNYISFFATYDSAIIGDVTYKNIKFYEGEPHTATIALGDTIYGGTVDFDSGVMTVAHTLYQIASSSDINKNVSEWPTNEFVTASAVGKPNSAVISNMYDNIPSSSKNVGCYVGNSGRLRINTSSVYSSKDDVFNNELKDATFYIELATPTTIQLTPQQIQLLKGTNTLYASTGQISVTVNGVSGSIGAVQEQVNDHEERIEALESGGGTVKELRYTGTGTTPNTIDFGNDTPKRIMCIIPDPDEEFVLSNYEAVGEISWGMMIALSYWSTQSGGVPTTSNGGTNLIRMSFSGNTMTLNAGNAAQIANYSGQKYLLKYEV